MYIDVNFGSVTLPNVKRVTPGSVLSTEMILGSGVQFREKSLSAKGFVISRTSRTPENLAEEQRLLENLLSDLGSQTLTYPGTNPYEAYISSIEWEEWTGNPIIGYSVNFITSSDNPFSSGVTVGAISLDPIPQVSDRFKSHSIDDRISSTREKEIVISGRFEGSPTEVNILESNLIGEVTGSDSVNITISTGTYICKVGDLTFGVPDSINRGMLKNYTLTLSTLPDWSLEDFQTGDDGLNIAGVSIDVVSSNKHDVGRNLSDTIESETMSVSGKKFFHSFGECNAFKDIIDNKVINKTVITSSTGNNMLLNSVGWSEPQRDGHHTNGDRRYSISFSLNFKIDSASVQGISGIILGINFPELSSISYGASLDGDGSIVTRNKSGSGKVESDPTIREGDSVVDGGITYFITSLSLGQKDKAGLRQVSISGQTLDSTQAAQELVQLLFAGFMLDHVENQTDSVSYQNYDGTNIYKAVSIQRSVSGFRLNDEGNVKNLIQTIDRVAGEFFVTNINVGQKNIVKYNGNDQIRIPISLSGIEYLVKPLDPNRPDDIKVEISREREDSTTKYSQIPMPAKGIVFKKIGLNPDIETVTSTNRARTENIFRTMNMPTDPSSSIAGATKIGRREVRQGLSKSVTIKYQKFIIV